MIGAIDYSMTSPAICINGDKLFAFTKRKQWIGTHQLGHVELTLLKPYVHKHFIDRADFLSNWITELFKTYSVDQYFIEGYAFGGFMGNDNGEHCGILKYRLWKELSLLPIETPAPKVIKKSFTNNGNADKETMVKAFESKLGVSLSSVLNKDIYATKTIPAPITDMVDAYALYHYGTNK